MPTKSVVVGSAVGLHARPAAIIAEAADAFDDEIVLKLVGGDDDRQHNGDADHEKHVGRGCTQVRSGPAHPVMIGRDPPRKIESSGPLGRWCGARTLTVHPPSQPWLRRAGPAFSMASTTMASSPHTRPEAATSSSITPTPPTGNTCRGYRPPVGPPVRPSPRAGG